MDPGEPDPRGPSHTAGETPAEVTPTAAEDPIPGMIEKPPRIDAVVFARRGDVLGGRVPLSAMGRLLAADVGESGVLEWNVEGSVVRDLMQLRREALRVRTRFSPWMTCSKCLEPVEIRDLATDTLFRLAATEAQAAVEDRESEDFDAIAADPHLDLCALVEDEAILALPMAPAHANCEGIATDDPGLTGGSTSGL